MEDLHEFLDELKEISTQEELLESVDDANKKFILNSFKKRKFKIYDGNNLPYELSDEYLSSYWYYLINYLTLSYSG